MAIPKIIHYCWMSGDLYPDDIKECICSWKRIMPDYEIKLWNKTSFDVNKCSYTRQAMEAKKYAFVSDYIRLYALYNEGGIYLDSDVMAIKKFDALLDNKAFIGFESGGRLGPWLIASEERNPLIKELLDYYIDKEFVMKNGDLDMTPNTVPVTNILVKHGLLPDNCEQRLEDITIYPEEYFSPKNPWTNKTKVTDHTYAMHLFKGGWNDKTQDELIFISKIEERLKVFLNEKSSVMNEIYLYGMGVVGRNVLEQIAEMKFPVRVKGILVTKRDNGWISVEGVPIIEVSDKTILNTEIPVLITTVPRTYDSIISSLKENGFCNYFTLGF